MLYYEFIEKIQLEINITRSSLSERLYYLAQVMLGAGKAKL